MKRNRNNTLLYALLSTLTLLSGWHCRKDEDGFRPYERTLDALDQLLTEVPDPSLFTVFTLSGLIPDTLLSTPSGMLLSLTDTENLLTDEGGQPLSSSTCNTLNIEVTEVRKQGDMLARGLHSEAEAGQLLDAVVMVKLRFLCDDTPVKLRTDRIMLLRVPVNTATLDDDYQTYFSSTASDSAFTRWAFPGTPAYFAEWPVGQNLQKGYELVVDRLGWIACARPVFNSTASTFCVQLDAPYNVQNTRAYLVFEGVNAVAALRAAPGSTAFCYPQAPVGYPVQVISTTKLDSGYELGNFNTEIGTNSETPLTPVSISEQALINFLRTL
jgi:hypothetical protein